MVVHGTTVLSCGCGVPWSKDHDVRNTALICPRHEGVQVITEIR